MSDQFQQGPAKKVKTVALTKPKKALAKLARKKNDKKSDRSIREHVKMAEKVESEKVGPNMERELVRIEKKLDDWKKTKEHKISKYKIQVRFFPVAKGTDSDGL